MNKFLIKVNGIPYEVEVEELPNPSAGATQPVKALKGKVSGLATASHVPKESITKTDNYVPKGTKVIVASMPGTILKVNVSKGDTIKKGQVLLIQEAMKMENEITAPFEGVVASVSVEKGKAVSTGEILVSLD